MLTIKLLGNLSKICIVILLLSNSLIEKVASGQYLDSSRLDHRVAKLETQNRAQQEEITNLRKTVQEIKGQVNRLLKTKCHVRRKRPVRLLPFQSLG